MAIRNEITIGANPLLNNLVMYRKVDNKPFTPEFTFVDDNTLDMGSNIEVRYIEYYKDSEGNVIPQLTQYKTYVVPNRAATYKQVTIIDTPATYYVQGEIITPAILDENDVEITPAVIALGGELKTSEVSHTETQIDTPAWPAANGWFLQLARTPITAAYGIMDSIEATLQGLPMSVPTGYHLQQPL